MELVEGICQSMGHQGKGLPILVAVDLALSQDLQVRKEAVGAEEAMMICCLLLCGKDFSHTQRSHVRILTGVERTWKALEEKEKAVERS